MGKIIIIANARWRGGLSGSDNIYLNFARYWGSCEIWDMLDVDFKPFCLCYIYRILAGCWRAMRENERYEFVYSASDFLMDSIPAFILKLKGNKWVAGFYLNAPKKNWIYYCTQKIAKLLIKKFADKVCLTNESMFNGWRGKRKIAVQGGVNLENAGSTRNRFKLYDAVFVGRFHHSKGIDELIRIWKQVKIKRPCAKLAVIGGGDAEEDKVKKWAEEGKNGVHLWGYLGQERFKVYQKSRIVLYPATVDHFSMGPVEAMACGCPMVAFNLPVMKYIRPEGTFLAENVLDFAFYIHTLLTDGYYKAFREDAYKWARTWDWSKRAPKVLAQIRSLS